MMSEVSRRADALLTSGLNHGDRIVVAQEVALDYLLDLFAVWEAGLCAVAVNSRLTAAEQKTVLEKTGARLWLSGYEAVLPELRAEEKAAKQALKPDEPALILMTSGTTGNPKGVVHSLETLSARIAANIAEIGRESLQRSLCVLPVFFGHGLIGNCLTPLMAGGTVYLWPSPNMLEMRDLASLIDQHGIGFISSVPAFWQLALRMAPKPQKALERVHIGSAPLSCSQWQAIADWAGAKSVFNMYGMSEMANWIAGGSLHDAGERDGFVGHPWGGALSVLKDEDEIATHGVGEVLVQSPGMMLRYWDDPLLTEQSFIDGWFRTGDVGSLDEAGSLTLLGRTKSEINLAGIKVLAEEVDMLLERHVDVAEACAFAMPDTVAGEAVAAAVVLKEGAIFDEEGIRGWCREQARLEAVPVRLFEFASLSRNDRGKIMRAEVQRAALEDRP